MTLLKVANGTTELVGALRTVGMVCGGLPKPQQPGRIGPGLKFASERVKMIAHS